MAAWSYADQVSDMECDEPQGSSPAAGGVAGPIQLLSHDELRHVFQFVPDLDRRALQPVCKAWALVGLTCGLLMTSATVDAEGYTMRRGHHLDWLAACHWLNRHLHGRSTLKLRLTTGHHNMPAGGLYSVLPPFADSLRTLHLRLGAPGLTSRDMVGLGRLTLLRELTIGVQITAEVLVTGLQELQPLSSLTHLSIDASVPPPPPACARHADDFPTPNYGPQYPPGLLHAPFSLNLFGMPHLQSLRFVADTRAVHFDKLPPGLINLSGLTSLHLNNCFVEAPPHGFEGLSQLQRLALEDFKFETPRPSPRMHGAKPAHLVHSHPLNQLSGLSSLRQLSLRRCKLDEDGARLVAQLLPHLEELDVSGNRRLERHEEAAQAAEALDSWLLRQYLAGGRRKRKTSPTMYTA